MAWGFFFFCLGSVGFGFQTIFRSKVQQSTASRAGRPSPGRAGACSFHQGEVSSSRTAGRTPRQRGRPGSTPLLPSHHQHTGTHTAAAFSTKLSLSPLLDPSLPSFVLGYPSSSARRAVDMKQYSHDIWIFLLQQ